MKDKLLKLLNAKREQRNTLNNSMIESDSKEERAAIGETLTKLGQEIADLEAMLDEIDDPAAAQGGEGEGGEGRSFNPIAAMQMRTGVEGGQDPQGLESIEARAQRFAETHRTNMDASEVRSILLSSGGIATPTEVGGINDMQNVVSSIVDMTAVDDLTGMGSYKEVYQTALQTASKKTDGTAQTGSDPVFKTAAINPFLLSVTTYVSRELRKQTPIQYEAKVREGAMKALKKKLANWMVAGDGTNEIYGIVNAVNTTSEAIYGTLDLTGNIDDKTLRKIVFAYGGDENIGSNAVLILNKKDLIAFGDVRGTNEKKAVYEIIPNGDNPNTGIIKDGGLSVPYVICSDVASYKDATATSAGVKTMIYGDPKNYKLGLFGNYEIRVSEDYKFGEGLDTIMGEVMVGGNVIADNGFVVCLKKTAASA